MTRTPTRPSRRSPDGKYATGRARREAILQAAADLFGRRGFAATSLDDIGSAAGITASGVYRHFSDKLDLLVAIFDRALRTHLEIVGAVDALGLGPRDALDELVRRSAREMAAHPEIALVSFREEHYLSADQKRELAGMRRRLVADWMRFLEAVRPDLDEEARRIAVQACSGLLNGMAFIRSPLASPELADVVADMALQALLGFPARGTTDRDRKGTRWPEA